MQVVVKSVYPPSIVSWGKEKRIIGGTIEWIEVDGKLIPNPDKFDATGIKLECLKHISMLKRDTRSNKIQVPGRPYVLTVTEHEIQCTCPGYQFRKTCKHILAHQKGEF